MKDALQALIERVEQHPAKIKQNKVDWNPYPTEELNFAKELTQDYLWDVSLIKRPSRPVNCSVDPDIGTQEAFQTRRYRRY